MRHLERGDTGRLSVGDTRREVSVYVMNGEVVAAEATEDDHLLIRRLENDRALAPERARALRASAEIGESVFGVLLEEVDPHLFEQVLYERFRDNLARFLGSPQEPAFQALTAVFVDNLQLGHDAERLIAESVHLVDVARHVRLEARLVARHPEDAAGPQTEIVTVLGEDRTVRDVLADVPLEPILARAMIGQMITNGILVPAEAESRPEAPPEPAGDGGEEPAPEDLPTEEVPTEELPTEIIDDAVKKGRGLDISRMETEVLDQPRRRPRKLGDVIANRARAREQTPEAEAEQPVETRSDQEQPTEPAPDFSKALEAASEAEIVETPRISGEIPPSEASGSDEPVAADLEPRDAEGVSEVEVEIEFDELEGDTEVGSEFDEPEADTEVEIEFDEPEAPDAEEPAPPAETETEAEVPDEPETEAEAPAETETGAEAPAEPETGAEAPAEPETEAEAPDEPEAETPPAPHEVELPTPEGRAGDELALDEAEGPDDIDLEGLELDDEPSGDLDDELSGDAEDLDDEPSGDAEELDPSAFLHHGVEVDEAELEAFADHDYSRGVSESDGAFSTEQHNLDRVEVASLTPREPPTPEPDDEGLVEVDEAPQSFGARLLSEDEARRKLGVANAAIEQIIAAFDASEGAGRGRATLQILLDGSPQKFAVLFQDITLDDQDRLPESSLLRNLHGRPQTEHRQLLNQGLVDLIERALSLAMDEISDDNAIDMLLENTAGYRQRIGL